MRHEVALNDIDSFINWAWDFAWRDTQGLDLFLSDGTRYYHLPPVKVIGRFVALESMEAWCHAFGRAMGIPNYWEFIQNSGYLLNRISPLSIEDQVTMLKKSVISRKDFLNHPVTQIYGSLVISLIPLGNFGTFRNLFSVGKNVGKNVAKGEQLSLEVQNIQIKFYIR